MLVDYVCEGNVIFHCLDLLRDTNEISWCRLENKWVYMREDCIILAQSRGILIQHHTHAHVVDRIVQVAILYEILNGFIGEDLIRGLLVINQDTLIEIVKQLLISLP